MAVLSEIEAIAASIENEGIVPQQQQPSEIDMIAASVGKNDPEFRNDKPDSLIPNDMDNQSEPNPDDGEPPIETSPKNESPIIEISAKYETLPEEVPIETSPKVVDEIKYEIPIEILTEAASSIETSPKYETPETTKYEPPITTGWAKPQLPNVLPRRIENTYFQTSI